MKEKKIFKNRLCWKWEQEIQSAEPSVLFNGPIKSSCKEFEMDVVFLKIDKVMNSMTGLREHMERAKINKADRDIMQGMLKGLVQGIEGFYYLLLQNQLKKEQVLGMVIDELRIERRLLQRRVEELEGGWARLEELEGVGYERIS